MAADEQIIIEIKVEDKDVKEAKKAFDKLNSSITDLERQVSDSKKENRAYNKEIDNINSSLKAKNITTEQAAKRTAELTSKIEKNNASIAKSTVELNQQRIERTANAKVISTETRAYDALSNKLGIARKEAKNIGAALGESSKEFKNAQAKVQRLDKQLKSLDDTLGTSQRHVGDYKRQIQLAAKEQSEMQKGAGNLKSALKNLGSVMLASFGISELTDFFKTSLDNYNLQIEVEKKLETVLRQRTNATDEQIQAIKDLTSEQQRNGVIGDEIQIAGAQQLATFVEQTSSIETLLPALNNLLAQQKGVNATSQDAVTIGNMVGKVLQGQVGSLSKVGITFSEAQGEMLKYGSESERAATLAEIITSNVGDMNKALTETDAGAIKQLSNNFGDAQETIGSGVSKVVKELAAFGTILLDSFTKGNAITRVYKSIGDGLTELGQAIGKVFRLFGDTSNATGVLDTVLSVLSTTLRIATTPFRVLVFVLTKIFESIAFVGSAFVNIGTKILDFAKSFDFVNTLITKVTSSFGFLRDKMVSFLQTFGLLDEVVDTNTDATNKNTDATNTNTDATNKNISTIEDLDDAIKDLSTTTTEVITKQDDFNTSLHRGNENIKESIQSLKDINKERAKWLQNLKETEDIEIDTEQFDIAIVDLVALPNAPDFNNIVDLVQHTFIEISELSKDFTGEQAEVFKEIALGITDIFKVGEGEAVKALNGLSALSNSALVIFTNNKAKELKILEEEKDRDLEIAGDNVALKEEIETNFQDKKNELRLNEFKAEKANALVQITIQTALAVMKSFAASPFTGGMPYSLIAGALGAVQAGIVASQQPPTFAKGTNNIVTIGDSHASGNDVMVVGYTKGGQSQIFGKVERGEAMPVIRKSAANMLEVSRLNNSYKPNSFFAGGTQDIITNNTTNNINEISINDIAQEVAKRFSVGVRVEDITEAQSLKVSVRNNASV